MATRRYTHTHTHSRSRWACQSPGQENATPETVPETNPPNHWEMFFLYSIPFSVHCPLLPLRMASSYSVVTTFCASLELIKQRGQWLGREGQSKISLTGSRKLVPPLPHHRNSFPPWWSASAYSSDMSLKHRWPRSLYNLHQLFSAIDISHNWNKHMQLSK